MRSYAHQVSEMLMARVAGDTVLTLAAAGGSKYAFETVVDTCGRMLTDEQVRQEYFHASNLGHYRRRLLLESRRVSVDFPLGERSACMELALRQTDCPRGFPAPILRSPPVHEPPDTRNDIARRGEDSHVDIDWFYGRRPLEHRPEAHENLHAETPYG